MGVCLLNGGQRHFCALCGLKGYTVHMNIKPPIAYKLGILLLLLLLLLL